MDVAAIRIYLQEEDDHVIEISRARSSVKLGTAVIVVVFAGSVAFSLDDCVETIYLTSVTIDRRIAVVGIVRIDVDRSIVEFDLDDRVYGVLAGRMMILVVGGSDAGSRHPGASLATGTPVVAVRGAFVALTPKTYEISFG